MLECSLWPSTSRTAEVRSSVPRACSFYKSAIYDTCRVYMDFHKDSHEGFLYEIHTLGIKKTQARVSLGFRDLGPLVLGRSEREHLTVLSSKTPASPFSSGLLSAMLCRSNSRVFGVRVEGQDENLTLSCSMTVIGFRLWRVLDSKIAPPWP